MPPIPRRPMPPSRLLALPVLTAAMLLSLAGCNAPTGAGGPPAMPPPEVGFVTVTTTPVTLTTELPGRTAPYRIAEVRPQVGGIVLERPFDEGGPIAAGQVLYRIDPARYRAGVDSAEAALTSAKATLERAALKATRHGNLLKAKAVSQEDYDDANAALKEAQAAVAVAEAELAAARIDLAYTDVKSPIPGRVGRSAVTQGALVTANQELALATVQQLDPIYVDLSQSSAQLLKLRRALDGGQLARRAGEQPTVTLILEDGTAYPLPGRLEFSEVSVDKGTGAVTLRATFPNPDQLLLPGMFVRAVVEEGVRDDAILVPQQGVARDRRGDPTALVIGADGTVEQRTLKVERTQGNRWIVDDGLAPGDRLIVEGTLKVRPGDKAVPVDVTDQPAFAQSDAPAGAAGGKR